MSIEPEVHSPGEPGALRAGSTDATDTRSHPRPGTRRTHSCPERDFQPPFTRTRQSAPSHGGRRINLAGWRNLQRGAVLPWCRRTTPGQDGGRLTSPNRLAAPALSDGNGHVRAVVGRGVPLPLWESTRTRAPIPEPLCSSGPDFPVRVGRPEFAKSGRKIIQFALAGDCRGRLVQPGCDLEGRRPSNVTIAVT